MISSRHTNEIFRLSKLRERIFIDLTGKVFGEWTVLKEIKTRKRKEIYWLCKCSCGCLKEVCGNSLRQGISKRCVGCRNKINSKRGRDSNLYRHGNGYDYRYPSKWNHSLKEFIRNRDNRKCKFPNCHYDDTKEPQRLCVHHINGIKELCEPYNLVSLCRKHHRVVENSPDLWQDYFYSYTYELE